MLYSQFSFSLILIVPGTFKEGQVRETEVKSDKCYLIHEVTLGCFGHDGTESLRILIRMNKIIK